MYYYFLSILFGGKYVSLINHLISFVNTLILNFDAITSVDVLHSGKVCCCVIFFVFIVSISTLFCYLVFYDVFIFVIFLWTCSVLLSSLMKYDVFVVNFIIDFVGTIIVSFAAVYDISDLHCDLCCFGWKLNNFCFCHYYIF